MFIILPWKVDVPQDRWPVMNWLIIAVTIAVFVLQIADILEYESRQGLPPRDSQRRGPETTISSGQPAELASPQPQEPPGITGALMLRNWNLKGLFGHMWLHGGLFHLAGNMLFLWIFGNAVCAKMGNLKYLPLYVLLGMTAGVAHLLWDSGPALGASGAINGVVGMYLVLFYENEITCLFAGWLLVPYLRWFEVSSIWMILFWLLWDIIGALSGGSGVAYYAHLGGFAAGFGIAFLMCKRGWITMERYEKSLLQVLEQRRHGGKNSSFNLDYVRLGLSTEEPEPHSETPAAVETKPIPMLELEPGNTGDESLTNASIRTACACGQAIKVTQQYAGRTVRCPSCRQPVVIPHKTDCFGPGTPRQKTPAKVSTHTPDHYIRFRCSCGRKLRVPADRAGRAGKCPHCGAGLTVPSVSE